MKWMLQVRFNGADIAINELPTREQQAIFAEFEAVGQLPGVLQGNQLQPATTATTVRMCDGQTEVAAGLPIDSAAALDGFYLYDAPDRDTAIAFAARIPATRFGAAIEIRPVLER
jgi:hypothetical protein